MPVIINEFEVVPEEPQPSSQRPGDPGDQERRPVELSPADIERIIRRLAARRARLRAD